MIILLPFLLFVYKSFTFNFLEKNGVIRNFKVQFATHEKWRLKLGNRLLQRELELHACALSVLQFQITK